MNLVDVLAAIPTNANLRVQLAAAKALVAERDLAIGKLQLELANRGALLARAQVENAKLRDQAEPLGDGTKPAPWKARNF